MPAATRGECSSSNSTRICAGRTPLASRSSSTAYSAPSMSSLNRASSLTPRSANNVRTRRAGTSMNCERVLQVERGVAHVGRVLRRVEPQLTVLVPQRRCHRLEAARLEPAEVVPLRAAFDGVRAAAGRRLEQPGNMHYGARRRVDAKHAHAVAGIEPHVERHVLTSPGAQRYPLRSHQLRAVPPATVPRAQSFERHRIAFDVAGAQQQLQQTAQSVAQAAHAYLPPSRAAWKSRQPATAIVRQLKRSTILAAPAAPSCARSPRPRVPPARAPGQARSFVR